MDKDKLVRYFEEIKTKYLKHEFQIEKTIWMSKFWFWVAPKCDIFVILKEIISEDIKDFLYFGKQKILNQSVLFQICNRTIKYISQISVLENENCSIYTVLTNEKCLYCNDQVTNIRFCNVYSVTEFDLIPTFQESRNNECAISLTHSMYCDWFIIQNFALRRLKWI